MHRTWIVGVVVMIACGGGRPAAPDAAPRDARPPDAPSVAAWREVPFQPIPARPILCVQGVGGDVFFSGGSIGTGRGSLALRFDGQWHELDIHVEETLWWLWPRARDDVWFVGEKGIVVHWDGARATAARVGTDATLFGVWGSSATDVWAVGGSPTSMGDNDLLYHYDGTTWTKVPPPEALGVAYLKIWGSGPGDVFVVGRQGVIVHHDGQRWARQESGSQAILTTVHGTGPRDVWAVGGPSAVVLHYDGTRWAREPGIDWKSAAVSGVWAEADGTVWIAGWGGEAWRRKGGQWVDETPSTFAQDLHVVWADGAGNAFAGGGSFLAPASATLVRRGFLGRYGAAVPPATVSMP